MSHVLRWRNRLQRSPPLDPLSHYPLDLVSRTVNPLRIYAALTDLDQLVLYPRFFLPWMPADHAASAYHVHHLQYLHERGY